MKAKINPRPKTKVRDTLFLEKKEKMEDFNFGPETAKVFDDMLDRSVPFYAEIQRMMTELAKDFALEGTNLYDLGCATGYSLLSLDKALPKGIRFVGVDYSPDMLDKTREKLEHAKVRRPYELVQADLNNGIEIDNASVVILNLTLQFVRPLRRENLIRQLVKGMTPNGALLLVEKVLQESSDTNRIFIKHYYEFKERQGYSRLEIAQKREALENVLIPYRLEENYALLRAGGFKTCDVFFKWYNFCGIIATR